MSKLILILFLVSFLQFLNPIEVFAGNNLCEQTRVQIDINDNFNTIVTIDTRIDLNRNGQAGEILQISPENSNPATTTVPNNSNDPNFGLAIFQLGKLTPGDYKYALFIMEKDSSGNLKRKTGGLLCGRTGDGAIFHVDDVSQGGEIPKNTEWCPAEKRKIIVFPEEPKPNDKFTIGANQLPEDAIYFASVTKLGNKIEQNQYQCGSSINKTLEFSFEPLIEGTWQVVILKNANQIQGGDCMAADGNVIVCGEIMITKELDNSTKDSLPKGCTGSNCTSAAGEVCDIFDGSTIKTLIRDRGFSEEGAKNFFKNLPSGNVGIWTAIGCIPTEPTALIKGLLKFAMGAGGGIALLLMIYGAFQIITSAGNPDGVKKGHEQITSAVMGLLFIIFAVMLLKVIGVDILKIPGFGS